METNNTAAAKYSIPALCFEVEVVRAVKEMYGSCDTEQKLIELLGKDFCGTIEDAIVTIHSTDANDIFSRYGNNMQVVALCAKYGVGTKDEIKDTFLKALDAPLKDGIMFTDVRDVLKLLEMHFAPHPNFTTVCLSIPAEAFNDCRRIAETVLTVKGISSPETVVVLSVILNFNELNSTFKEELPTAVNVPTEVDLAISGLFPGCGAHTRDDIYRVVTAYYGDPNSIWKVVKGDMKR